jgi:glycerate kinase
MNVVIAIDSFKGSMSSMEAGLAAKRGVLKAIPDANIKVKPLADGGEGTTDALIEGLGGEKVALQVKGPMGNPVEAYYGYLKSSHTAVMEMAVASGITLIPSEKNPMVASTYGVGEMILDAIQKGCTNFMIGIGGSATNDAGIGMLKALGYEFLDKEGKDVGEGALALCKVYEIKDEKVPEALKACHFKVACDVNNPLYGKNGATYIYGPQKGVKEDQKERLDLAMKHFSEVTARYIGKDYAKVEGAGAAGGLGFAMISYLKASLVPGVTLICEAIRLEEVVKEADVVITGEGRLDAQTMMGKAPSGVAQIAKQYGKKVIAFAGSVSKDATLCNQKGIDAFFPIIRGITTLEEAMQKEVAMQNLMDTTEQVFRLFQQKVQ